MKQCLLATLALGLALGCFSAPAAAATGSDQTPPAYPSSAPGAEVAQTISLVTGVAISPLLGTSAVGAWKYFEAKTPEQRAKLPWFAQPWFWVPALLLVTACFLKDTVGIAVPTALKKPFDAIEVIEHKVSALVATGAFVPLVAPVFHSAGPHSSLVDTATMFATIDLSWLGNLIIVPAMMVAFVIVSLASSAINILILLSPFTTVDAALKAFRLFILSTVTVSAFANPWFGAIWALIIIAFAYLIAGWSFRLSHFGLVFIWDFVTGRSGRFTPDKLANRAFLGRKTDKVPTRSYGSLRRDESGRLVLTYRPWLLLPPRTLTLPEGQYAVGKGLLYSEILRVDGQNLKSAILLPPRYRSHEEQLVAIYGLTGVRDTGGRAALRWLRELMGFKPKPQPAGA
jgi:MFS family permease